MTRLRIVFTSIPSGGLDTYVLEAGYWLAEHGHEVHVIYFTQLPPITSPRYERIHFHTAHSGKLHYYLAKLDPFNSTAALILRVFEESRGLSNALKSLRNDVGYDLAEIHGGPRFASLFRGIPYVIKMHGSEWTLRQYCGDGPVISLLKTLDARMLKSARQVYAVSNAHASFVLGACNIPVPKMHIVRYPTDLSHFYPISPPTQGPPFQIMSVGRLEQRKGTHTLIKAMNAVWKQEPETHLYLFGNDGNFGKKQIEQIVPSDIFQSRVHLKGFVPRDSLIRHYQKSHIYVAPTRYEVSGGYNIQEAIACGRPVIASDISAVSELVRHEETGWLVPRDDADALAMSIIHALRTPEQREVLGLSARKLAERFDMNRVMPRQVALYQQAIEWGTS